MILQFWMESLRWDTQRSQRMMVGDFQWWWKNRMSAEFRRQILLYHSWQMTNRTIVYSYMQWWRQRITKPYLYIFMKGLFELISGKEGWSWLWKALGMKVFSSVHGSWIHLPVDKGHNGCFGKGREQATQHIVTSPFEGLEEMTLSNIFSIDAPPSHRYHVGIILARNHCSLCQLFGSLLQSHNPTISGVTMMGLPCWDYYVEILMLGLRCWGYLGIYLHLFKILLHTASKNKWLAKN